MGLSSIFPDTPLQKKINSKTHGILSDQTLILGVACIWIIFLVYLMIKINTYEPSTGGLRNLDTTKDVQPTPINPTDPANGIMGYKGSYGSVTFLATTTVRLDRGYL